MPRIRPLAPALLAGALLSSQPVAAAESYAVYESASDFETVMEGAKLAIQERGLYINNVLHLSDMLARTAADLGFGPPRYARAESIEFCSAALSHRMTSENPHRLVQCPFILSLYTLPEQPGKTFVVHRRIAPEEISGSAIMTEVAAMLREVAEGAVSW